MRTMRGRRQLFGSSTEKIRSTSFCAVALVKCRLRALERLDGPRTFAPTERPSGFLECCSVSRTHLQGLRVRCRSVPGSKKTRAHERDHHEHCTERHARDDSKSCTEHERCRRSAFRRVTLPLPRSLPYKQAARGFGGDSPLGATLVSRCPRKALSRETYEPVSPARFRLVESSETDVTLRKGDRIHK